MTTNGISIEIINVDEIKPAPFNPPHRTEDIADLVKSMKEDGFWPFRPLLISLEGILVDGHRRLAAAKKCGIEQVPVQKTDKPLEELWCKLNQDAGQKKVTARDALVATTLGLENPPKKNARAIKCLYSVFDVTELYDLTMKTNLTPGDYNRSVKIARFCNREDDKDFVKQVIIWQQEPGRKNMLYTAMKSGISPTVLRNAIVRNKDIGFSVKE